MLKKIGRVLRNAYFLHLVFFFFLTPCAVMRKRLGIQMDRSCEESSEAVLLKQITTRVVVKYRFVPGFIVIQLVLKILRSEKNRKFREYGPYQ